MFTPQSADPANASPDMAKGLRRYDKVKDLERGAEPGFHHKVLVRGRQEGRRDRKMPRCCFEEGGGAASQGAQASSSWKGGKRLLSWLLQKACRPATSAAAQRDPRLNSDPQNSPSGGSILRDTSLETPSRCGPPSLAEGQPVTSFNQQKRHLSIWI